VTTYKDGHHSYGQPVGILMLDTLFPRIPGEIGHAATFPFPVIHKVVHGASPKRVVLEGDPSLVEPFVTAARELEEMGVRAITTSCGFLALFHRQIAETIRVPFIASSLMQVPLVSRSGGGRNRSGFSLHAGRHSPSGTLPGSVGPARTSRWWSRAWTRHRSSPEPARRIA